ncbi:MAG: hypothetical protein ACE5OY_07960 [Candidatus Bathyarchaeia archaeon]
MTKEKLLVRLGGEAAEMLNELVRRGYFSTKTEVIRAGILKLGETFGLIRHPSYYWRELGEEIRRSGKRLTHDEIMAAIKWLERET